jgi:hypothetical protein
MENFLFRFFSFSRNGRPSATSNLNSFINNQTFLRMKTDYFIKRAIMYMTMAFAMAIQWTQLNAQNPVRVYSDLTETTLVSGHAAIQAAIDASTTLNGYVVRVDAGTYTENLSVNGKNLVFRGANSGLNNVNSPRAPETIINAATNAPLITLEANVTSYTIDGFKLIGADYNDGSNGRMVWAKNQTGNHNIINNVLELTSSQVNTKRYIWIGFSNSVNTGANYVSGSISHNLFEAIGTGSGFNGITVQQCSQNFHITGNRFVGMKGQRNILIWHPSVTTVIENNELARTDPFGDLVWFGGPGAHGAGLAGAVVRNNKFTCSNLALGFFNMDYNAAISNNDFSAVDGLAIEVTSGSGIADATCNWFGSNVVPSTKVAGNINVAPWLVSGVNTIPSVVGFTPQTGVCVGFPVQVKDGLTMAIKSGYATIQAAINAADPGDVVLVSPGSYNEDLMISKSINLEGPNVGIKGDGTSRTDEAQLLNGRITISGTHTVVVDGMQIYTTTNSPVDLILINSTSATVTIKNNRIERFGTAGGVIARGVVTAIGITTPVVIEDNYFTGDAAGGLFGGHLTLNNGIFCNGGSNILIKGNKFDITRTAINVDNMSAGVAITENIFENNGSALAFGGTTATTGSYIISGNSFKVFGTIANLSNVTTAFRLDLTGNTFDNKATSALDLVESFNIERTLFHRGRSSRNGAVTFVPNKQFVVAQNPSIQTAITYSNSGDEVLVEAGTYTENLLIDKAGLSILGPNSNLAGNNNARSPEAILQGVARVEANDVTIKGLSIDGTTVTQSTNLVMRGILVANTASRSGVAIENNIIQNWVTGISLAGGGSPGWVNNATIKGNLLINNSIGSTENATNLTIIDNSFDNGGIGLGGGATLAVPITGNTFANGASRYVAAASGVVADFGDILTNNTFDKAASVSAATGSWFDRAIFASIQPAINAAAAGATISVAAGTYAEDIDINKQGLILRGSNAGIAGSGVRSAEAIIDGLANSTVGFSGTLPEGVTIDGFTINGPAANPGSAMVIFGEGAGNDFVFQNNIVNISNQTQYGIGHGTQTPGLVTKTGWIIRNNVFNGPDAVNSTALNLWRLDNLLVEGNSINDVGRGIQLERNNIVTVANNTITNARGQGIAVASTNSVTTSNVTVTENVIINAGFINGQGGIRLFANILENVTVTKNSVKNSAKGLQVTAGALNWTNVTIENNDFSGNTTGLFSDATPGIGTVIATCNWWGQASGPDAGQIVGSVDASTWLITDNLTTPNCAGGQPVQLFESDGTTLKGGFAAIQAAINAATAGNVIEVAAGTYNEALTIDKSLTLKGAQVGEDPVAGGRTGGESVISTSGTFAVTVLANDVIINGFEIQVGGGTSTGFGINVRTLNEANPNNTAFGAYRENVSIKYNYIHANATAGQKNGIVFGEFTGDPARSSEIAMLKNLAIQNNYLDIKGGSARALIFGNHFDNVVFEDVVISDNTIIAGNNGLFISAAPAKYLANNFDVSNNIFTLTPTAINMGNLDEASKVINNQFIANGSAVRVNWRSTGGEIKDNLFLNNTIQALSFFDDQFFPQSSANVTVEGNTFNNNNINVSSPSPNVDLDFIRDNNTFDGYVLNVNRRNVFGKIQAAIDHVSTIIDDEIAAIAGNYTENVTVNKSVTVKGPNYDKTYDDNTRASEAVIDGNIEITAVDAAFSGFEINRSFLPASNWLMQVSGAGATISNNIIKIGTVQTSTVTGFIRLNTTGTDAVVFTGNELKMATPGSFPANTGINGLLTQGSGTYTITGNRFAVSGGTTTDADAVGITGGTVLFDGNLVNGDIMGGVTAYGNFGNVTISNNQISNYTDQLAGIRVVNCCGFDPATGFVTITGNTVGSTVSGTTGVGIIGVPAANILSLTNNDLSGNATALNFTGTGTLIATCNWFGDVTGPSVTQVSGDVLTAPFLLSDDLTNPDCTGYPPGTVFQRDPNGDIINFFTGVNSIENAISVAGFDPVNNIVNITGGEYSAPINATGNPDPAVTISIGTSPGCVTVTDLILSGNDTYLQDIEGPTACTEYDQLTVSGNVTLGGANLVVVLDPNYLPVNGAQFTIIDNTGSDPISGTFAQGNYIALGTVGFEINYQGGDGNDVVLTYCGGVLNTTTNERFCELQSAINASTTLDGHVLELEAGNYFGNAFSVGEIIVSKELTINGNNAGKAGSDASRDPESQLFGFFKLLRNNVTIDGLTIKSVGAALTNDKTNAFQVYAGGLLGSPAATSWFNDIKFINNIVSEKDGSTSVVSLDKSSNPNQSSLTTTNWEVSNNLFDNFVGTAGNTVISIAGVNGVKVNGNEINYNATNGANSLAGRIGVKVQMVGTARVEINDNVISLNADVSEPASRDAALAQAPFGIQILGSTKNFEVLRNTVDKAEDGIRINSSPSTGTSLVENATVSNNAITNANTGIRFNAGSYKDILGQGNSIDAFKSALVMDADAGTYVNVAFIENSLLSGAGFFGIQALTSSTVSPKVLSRCNWYGVADFAGVTVKNDGPNTIDFTQFATDGDLSDLKCGKVLQLAAFLEGPFDVTTGKMRTDLNKEQVPVLPILPIIPSVLESNALTQPYGTTLFGNYSGTETTTANYLSDNDSIVDWILIETRDAANRLTILERKAAFICAGGTVISHDGLPIVMETGGSATFHIALLHRNHANVATKDPAPGIWDIRLSSSNVFVQTVLIGGIPEPRKTLKPAGVFKLLYAGDSNNDNNITTLDFDAWIQRAGQNGYFLGDFDLSGNVTTTDTDLPIRNAGEGISFPQP